MSVFCQAVVYLLVALPAVAQSQAFATITIKPARSADPRSAPAGRGSPPVVPGYAPADPRAAPADPDVAPPD